MKSIVLAAALFFFLSTSLVYAQYTETPTSSDILLRLKKLNVLGSILYIAAHPDDENTRLLTWLSKERQYRTGYLSLTRGDGGQNLIGDEQGFELGLIRTQELLAARHIDGAEQFFSRAFDFGFSKTTTEAMALWNKEKILSDVVWVIRKFHPDVIITRFPEDGRAGHGHHSASSVLAHEAFIAAADSTRFPEQFKYGVRPWQAERIFWNTYNFGSLNTTSKEQLKIDVGGYNPLLGKSYGEIAATGRSQHKSQGFGVPHTRGSGYEYFSLTAGKPFDTDIMDGVDCSWKRVAGGERITALVNVIIKKFNPSDPGNTIASLVKLYRKLKAFPDGYWKLKKLQEIQDLIEACAGLFLEATVQSGYAVQGQLLTVNVDMVNRSKVGMVLTGVSLNGTDSSLKRSLTDNIPVSVTLKKMIPPDFPISQPYWLREPMSVGSFNVHDQSLIGDAQSKPALDVRFTLTIYGVSFSFDKAVLYKYTDDVKGERYAPLTVIPPVTAACFPDLLVFTGDSAHSMDIQTQKRTADVRFANLNLSPAPGFSLSKGANTAGEGQTFLALPTAAKQAVQRTQVTAQVNGRTDSLYQLRTIAYDHIPRIDYFRMAGATFVEADLRKAGKRVGYIEGAGDKLPGALRQMGYEVTLITQKDMNSGFLKTFDAIIAGVRAFDVHDWLFEEHAMLMKYVEDGGNLIVQYNRNEIGSGDTHIGPYPFSISAARVTDEHAEVRFVLPDHRVLNYPNKISALDFEGWIQERGIYFASVSDEHYEKIFSMHDPGESALEGSLIVTKFGKGSFAYTGLVFFRELPAGVPGAYRLLANLIALNQPLNK